MGEKVLSWNPAEDVITGPPTPDDVTVASDGRRIDTREKLIALVEELNRLPRPERAHGGD